MADESLKNSIKEHRYEDSPKQQQSHQEHDVNEARANSVKELKSITNIYYDCLERIFDFLDLESLLMVAQTCKRLQIAAAAKFGDEFGKKTIRLFPRGPEPEFIIRQNDIEAYGLKHCLAFLRCFGAKISDLFIDFDLTHPKEGYLDQYINQYCADTLPSIKFFCKSQFSNESFEKPFKNIEKVEICNVGLENQLKNFVVWFPNLRHLKMIYCSFEETAPMNLSFPHLEYLELYTKYHFRIEHVATLLQANPQLQSVKLRLGSELTLSMALNTIVANSLITKLQVYRYTRHSSINVSKEEINRLLTEHPSVKELILGCCRLSVDDAINFIRQMKLLKRIEFQVKDRLDCDRITQEFNNEWNSTVSMKSNRWYINLNR